MVIEHDKQSQKGAFYIQENGERLAELQYFISSPGKMTIFHTEVNEEFRGENIGEDLVAAAVKFARETKVKIIPTCSYAKKVIDDTPEYRDVLA